MAAPDSDPMIPTERPASPPGFAPRSPSPPPPPPPAAEAVAEPHSPSYSPNSPTYLPPEPADAAPAVPAADEPTIGEFTRDKGVTRFVISHVDTSIVNGLRRTILGQLPLLAIVPFPESDTTVRITANTTPMHNELIKQRLAAINFHLDPDDPLAGRLQVKLKVGNTSDTVRIVTVGDIELWDTVADKSLAPEATRAILPPDPITGDHAMLIVLRPPIGTMPGDVLELTATMRKMTSTANGMYTLASVCAMGNVADKTARDRAWKTEQAGDSARDRALWEETAKGRFDIPDTFSFSLRAVRWLDDRQLLVRGLEHMQRELTALADKGESGALNVTKVKDVLAKHTFDVEIPGDTYSLGHCLRHQLYLSVTASPQSMLSIVGFDKHHAHDKHGSLRMVFRNDASAVNASHITARAAREVASIYSILIRQLASRKGGKRTSK
jgi:hypothetical protein